MPSSPNYGFNCLFVRRFWTLHGVLFPGLASLNTLLFAMLVLVAAMEQYLAYK